MSFLSWYCGVSHSAVIATRFTFPPPIYLQFALTSAVSLQCQAFSPLSAGPISLLMLFLFICFSDCPPWTCFTASTPSPLVPSQQLPFGPPPYRPCRPVFSLSLIRKQSPPPFVFAHQKPRRFPALFPRIVKVVRFAAFYFFFF